MWWQILLFFVFINSIPLFVNFSLQRHSDRLIRLYNLLQNKASTSEAEQIFVHTIELLAAISTQQSLDIANSFSISEFKERYPEVVKNYETGKLTPGKYWYQVARFYDDIKNERRKIYTDIIVEIERERRKVDILSLVQLLTTIIVLPANIVISIYLSDIMK